LRCGAADCIFVARCLWEISAHLTRQLLIEATEPRVWDACQEQTTEQARLRVLQPSASCGAGNQHGGYRRIVRLDERSVCQSKCCRYKWTVDMRRSRPNVGAAHSPPGWRGGRRVLDNHRRVRRTTRSFSLDLLVQRRISDMGPPLSGAWTVLGRGRTAGPPSTNTPTAHYSIV
jgi:hypothetical protein